MFLASTSRDDLRISCLGRKRSPGTANRDGETHQASVFTLTIRGTGTSRRIQGVVGTSVRWM